MNRPNFSVYIAISILLALTIVATKAAQGQVLYTFTGGVGGNGPAGVTMDEAGNLYGTTIYGGAYGYGMVYELEHRGSGWIFSPLYSFAGGSDGASPNAGLALGPNGTLYGTTAYGGTGDGCVPGDYPGCGTVFNLRPPPTFCRSVLCPWVKTVLYNFMGGTDGGEPIWGTLIFDHSGNIYGTTQLGGNLGCGIAGGCGTVFELTPSGGGWTESVLYAFTSGTSDGAEPQGGLVFDNAGNLYGTTNASGLYNGGVIFQLTPSGSGWTEEILYAFQFASSGVNFFGNLIFDRSGNLYGTTDFGGSGNGGTVFQLTPSNGSWTLNILHSFTAGNNYCGPFGTLAMDGAGDLYGTTQCAGPGGYGSNIWELTASGGNWTYTSLFTFDGSDGAGPIGRVVLDSYGNLYGTTAAGGLYDEGIVWSY